MTTLRLASQVMTEDRLTLEADAVGHRTAVYDLLARLGSASGVLLHILDSPCNDNLLLPFSCAPASSLVLPCQRPPMG